MKPDDFLAKWKGRVEPRVWEEFAGDFGRVIEGQRNVANRARNELGAVHEAANKAAHCLEGML